MIDAAKAVTEVSDYRFATRELALTTLRATAGQHELDEVLSQREAISLTVQRIIDEHTEPWGIKVVLVELRNIDKLNEHRRRVAARYNERLGEVVQTPPEKMWARAVYHMYVIRTNQRDALADYLQSKGIGTGIHYPVANHQQPAITKMYFDLPKLPKTEAAVNEILSLPIYGELPLEDVDEVCDLILEFFGKQ